MLNWLRLHLLILPASRKYTLFTDRLLYLYCHDVPASVILRTLPVVDRKFASSLLDTYKGL